jgi:hypothetical protein
MNQGLRWTGMAAALAACCWAVAEASLYSPNRSIKDQGISLKGWGSGSAAETDEFAFEGTSSLRLASRNYFQGGILTYSTPVDLSKESADKANLILLTIMVPGTGTGMGSFGPGGSPFGPGGPPMGPGGIGGGGRPGGGPGGFGPQGPGGGAAGPMGDGAGGRGGAAAGPSSVSMVRMVLTTSDGKKAEAFVDLKSTIPDPKGWRRVGIPISAISGWENTNKTISSLAFSLDRIGVMYIGEASIVKDETPVYAEPNVRELNLALGDQVTLSGNGFAGATPLKYMWDFDKSDGVGSDAEGQVVVRRFRKPGEYVVTLTVVDVYGLKKPFSTEIKVTVNP